MSKVACPAILVSSIASGQGKTTVTAALARFHRNQGRRVRVFKTGPDFIDPRFLQAAIGRRVFNLDLWMVGAAQSKALLYKAACNSDLILVEGSMGLYDGTPSAADLACEFGIPVAAVIDAGAMAQTFGAVARGLKSYRDIPFAGVIANRVASANHASMLAESVPADIRLLASLPKTGASFPERHLGLVQAAELRDLDDKLNHLAQMVAQSGLTALPDPVEFAPSDVPRPERLSGRPVLAVARDAVFSFIYPANLLCLINQGVKLRFFSPLADEPIPPADALYLPGGYPELHAVTLGSNRRWTDSVRSFAAAQKPIYAECGGMMALFETIATIDGVEHAMAGLLPGRTAMRGRLSALGLQSLALDQGELRGHTFHYSELETPLEPALRCVPQRSGKGEAVYRSGSITASYLHAYFPSSPVAAASLLFGSR